MNKARLKRERLRSMTRITTAMALLCAITTAARAADRPNIILIYTDDQAANMTGFEGHPIVKTPNLDRLARESVFFTRCYVPTPQCAPSRACILTGQYPHTHGVTTNGPALPADADTFTARLKTAGYLCGIVGKWHLSYDTSKDPKFGLVDYVATNDRPWRWDNCNVWVQGKKTKADKFLTDWHGDRAIEFIEKFADRQPFFLWLCFRSPHAPLVYPPGTQRLYPPESVDLPKTMSIDVKGRPRTLAASPPVQGFKGKSEESIRQARSKYYAMITRIDENVGRLLARLGELKLRDNTVVVFASDNGWCLGDHGLYSKGPFFYEELIRGPLLVRYPKLARPGTKIDRVVSLVDLAPTFLELAGLTPPIAMHGKSLLPLIRDPYTARHADERFLEYDKQKGSEFPARGIVTRQYKFIDYLRDTDVLFDLKRDPGEMHNAINDAEYAAVVKVLRNRLERWRKTSKDPTLGK